MITRGAKLHILLTPTDCPATALRDRFSDKPSVGLDGEAQARPAKRIPTDLGGAVTFTKRTFCGFVIAVSSFIPAPLPSKSERLTAKRTSLRSIVTSAPLNSYLFITATARFVASVTPVAVLLSAETPA